MQENKIEKNSWTVFTAFWILAVFAFNFSFVGDDEVSLTDAFFGILVSMLILFFVSYLHIKYLIPLFNQKEYIKYGLLAFCLMSLILIVEYFVLKFWYPEFIVKLLFWQYLLSSIPFDIFLIGASNFIFIINKKWMLTMQEKIELQNEKLKIELNLLKAQINPHFLFNTLNNIYYYACTQHPETPEMIEKLSNILRYIVYEGSNNRTGFNREIESMDNLFSLYKMKNDEQKAITFEKSNYNQSLQIAPMLLLNLLENVFKHSDALINPNGFIHVKAKVDEADVLHFQIANSVKKHIGKKDKNGIGQHNIDKQLKMIYKDKYKLKTAINNNVFNLNLNIQLDRKEA
jgi:sensor histidine kinase YesM